MYASSDTDSRWQNINFNVVQTRVKKLQMRIAKAYKDGNYSKVETLQHRLIHSYSARVLAVKTVTTNRGKNTSGVDDILWNTQEDKWQAVSELKRRGYRPKPLKRVYIPKPDGTKRPLSIPTMKDRAMQTLYKIALEPIANTTADPHSYGFRNGQSTQGAINRCVEVLSGHNNHWILEADIKGCFDNISHDWILRNIPIDKLVLRKILKSGVIENGKYTPLERGVPQGSCISPIICNMALDGLDPIITTNSHHNSPIHFIRYADDFIITGKSKEYLKQKILPIVKSFLAERGLSLSMNKTVISHIDDGFDFLGWNVRRADEQVIVEPATKNLNSLLHKIRDVTKRNTPLTDEQQFSSLKPIITGWLNYHRGVVTKTSLSRAKSEILHLLQELTNNIRLLELVTPLVGTL